MNEQLQSIVSRIERLEADKAEVASDIRDVYAEAKSSGLDPKIIREIVRLRKKTEAEQAEFEAVRDTYMAALGMLADTPLGEAAMRAAA
jgi:uncharacterized protein (UPF0335 family)